MSAVANYLDEHLRRISAPLITVAEAAGIASGTALSMMRQGKMKVPIDRIAGIALAIEADPVELFKLCIAEYFPSLSAELPKMLETVGTPGERELMRRIRSYTNGRDFEISEMCKLRIEVLGEQLKRDIGKQSAA